MVERGYRSNINSAFVFYNTLKTNYPKAFNKEIDINVLSEVGKNLMKKGKTTDAITFLERNAKDFPDSDRSHFELATAYLKGKNEEKAIQELERTLDINPDHKQAREELKKLVH